MVIDLVPSKKYNMRSICFFIDKESIKVVKVQKLMTLHIQARSSPKIDVIQAIGALVFAGIFGLWYL